MASMVSDEEDRPSLEETRNEVTLGQDEGADSEDLDVGGSVAKPCFCLLDGLGPPMKNDDEAENQASHGSSGVVRERLTVPIDKLPAILGRAHANEMANFIPLSSLTTISRNHCKIEYWCSLAGRLEQKNGNEGLSFVPNKGSSTPAFRKLTKNLPDDQPFYTISCLGKNKVYVNGSQVEKGETAMLRHGSVLRIANCCLYFLLPTKKSEKTMKISLPPAKKRKATAAGTKPDGAPFKVTSSGLTATATTQSKRGRGFSNIQAELEKLDNDELLRQLTTAIEEDAWDRRHNLIGSTLSSRAVEAAGTDPAMRKKCREEEGVSRDIIMDWIADSEEFSEWSRQMLTKLEAKSYQASITKAMIKAGFTRTASAGRYIKWMFPGMDIPEASKPQVDAGESKKDDETNNSTARPSMDAEGDHRVDQPDQETIQKDETDGTNQNMGDSARETEQLAGDNPVAPQLESSS